MRNLSHKWPQSGYFSQKLGNIFPSFQKRAGETSPLPPLVTSLYYKRFYWAWKKTFHKPLKVEVAKKSFPSVYIIDTTRFDQCFLFHVITESIIFYKNSSLPRDLV